MQDGIVMEYDSVKAYERRHDWVNEINKQGSMYDEQNPPVVPHL